MDHNIMWSWSWNHWTSPPALGPWSRTTAWWTGHWLQPAVSCRPAAVRGEPEFKFSSGQSSSGARTGLYSVHMYSPRPGLVRVCTTVRGPGLEPGRVISLDIAIVTSTQSPSVTTQCYYRVRESPAAQGSVHQLAPVLACAELTCVRPPRAQPESETWSENLRKTFSSSDGKQGETQVNPANNQCEEILKQLTQHTLTYCVTIILQLFSRNRPHHQSRVQCSISWWNDGKRHDMTSPERQNIWAGSNSVTAPCLQSWNIFKWKAKFGTCQVSRRCLSRLHNSSDTNQAWAVSLFYQRDDGIWVCLNFHKSWNNIIWFCGEAEMGTLLFRWFQTWNKTK